MNHIQIQSVSKTFEQPEILQRIITLTARVAAMGLLPKGRRIERLDEEAFHLVLKSLQAGNLIGARNPLLARMAASPLSKTSTKQHIAELDRLLAAIEESPVPEKEWVGMRGVFRDEELGHILNISSSSLKRYTNGERDTPLEIADRLHWLTMMVADLAGSYNDFGIRRWFHRSRAQLDGKSPLEFLGENWNSDSQPATRVRDLARSLSGSGAT